MDRLARLILFLILALPLPSFAAFSPPSICGLQSLGGADQRSGSTPQAACTASALSRNSAYTFVSCTATTATTGTCSFSLSGSNYSGWKYAASSCPSNSSLSGSSCVCASGYEELSGSCVQNNCPSADTQLLPSGQVREAGNGLTNVVCLAGCEASAFMAAKHDGKNYVWGPVRATGRSCAASIPTPPGATEANPACPVGKCPGTVNGQSICVPCSETKQDTKASSSETAASAASGATPGPGQTTTQSGSSSTTCVGDTCTTTGQQTVTNPDGSTETKSTTTTQSKGDYCKENPKAGACTGSESTWGGTCQAFTCDGDAVQCAQARGAWELACQLKTEATDPTVQAGTEAMAGTGEAAIKDQLGMNTSQVFDLASRLDSTSLFGTPGACPSDTTLSLGIGSVTLPFASMCPQLNLLGVAMMGLAYLIAAFIVFRPRKGA